MDTPSDERQRIEARNRLVMENITIPICVWNALKWFPPVRNLGREDAIAEGYKLLVEVAQTYDPAKSSFGTWSFLKVRYGVLDVAYSRVGRSVHVPPNVVKMVFREELDETDARHRYVIAAIRPARNVNCAKNSTGLNIMPKDHGMAEDVRLALSMLSDKQRRAIRAYFGFGCDGPRTMKQIAQSEGVTEGAISLRITTAINALAHLLRQYERAPDVPVPSEDEASPVLPVTAAADSPA